jgi:hypothetical protein
LRNVVHDIRNQLAVAIANVEAFLEGKLEPSHTRLATVLASLNEIDALLDGLRHDVPDEEHPSGRRETQPNV